MFRWGMNFENDINDEQVNINFMQAISGRNLEFVRFFGAMFVYLLLRLVCEWRLGIRETGRENFSRKDVKQMEYFD